MQLETLSCNSCGGPLKVPASANYVTCNHCRRQLVIRRTESASFTEELGEIRSNQEEMMEKLNRLELQNQLAQIDREWERERQSFMIRDKHGNRREPSEFGAIFGGVIAVGFGIFWTMMAASMHGGMAPFGVIFILFGAGISIYGYNKAKDFRAAQKRYLRKKKEVYSGSRDNSEILHDFEHPPTPEEYLDQLGDEER